MNYQYESEAFTNYGIIIRGMGMFNTINSQTKCPECKGPLEWQSKNLSYKEKELANILDLIILEKGMSGEMHAYCNICQKSFTVQITDGHEGSILPRE